MGARRGCEVLKKLIEFARFNKFLTSQSAGWERSFFDIEMMLKMRGAKYVMIREMLGNGRWVGVAIA